MYIIPGLEKKGPEASTCSKLAPELLKDRYKGLHNKNKGPRNDKNKGKGKANCHRPYPKGYRIPKLEPSAMDSVFNMARTPIELTAKNHERGNRAFPKE
ncbi:hypothetical protein O181_029706 [Austropuccinia psidii MF-1]|uniref:Uncharacterized protein n=1 Tax=Austropuccinia psidii MF-1 TaxID=1389203 RepID=A0A9Q3CRJ0_9BASI|nr:hypothetical protein [Austropuccinia psidii MF-1]